MKSTGGLRSGLRVIAEISRAMPMVPSRSVGCYLEFDAVIVADLLVSFDLKAGGREHLDKPLDGGVEIAVILEPVVADVHQEFSVLPR